MAESISQGIEVISDPKVVFEKQVAEFVPDYSDLEAKSGYSSLFAKGMRERSDNHRKSYDSALEYKSGRLSVMEGLPITAAICLIHQDENGEWLIMLPTIDQEIQTETLIHEDIWYKWKEEYEKKSDSDEARLFANLRPRGTGWPPMHASIIESTVGRQLVVTDGQIPVNDTLDKVLKKIAVDYKIRLVIDARHDKRLELPAALFTNIKYVKDTVESLKGVISDRSLRIYKNLAESLYLKYDGTIERDSQKWNFIKDMEKIADNVRTKKLFGVDPPKRSE